MYSFQFRINHVFVLHVHTLVCGYTLWHNNTFLWESMVHGWLFGKTCIITQSVEVYCINAVRDKEQQGQPMECLLYLALSSEMNSKVLSDESLARMTALMGYYFSFPSHTL